MNLPSSSGIQFPLDNNHQRSTTAVNKAIYSAALNAIAPDAAQAVRDEANWRKQYPRHLRALTEIGIQNPSQALHIAATALDEAWQQFDFIRQGQTLPLAAAIQQPTPQAFHTAILQGEGPTDIKPWSLPYRGQQLQGEALRQQIGRWQTDGIIEPSHAQALHRVMEHPEWFDLSDHTFVLLGAASEAGPLASLAQWRANIVAIDLPQPAIWQKIIQTVHRGNGRLIAPTSQPITPNTPPEQWLPTAGANLLTQTPELIAWLQALDVPLDIAAIAYLDGERHVRVSLAMDAIMTSISHARPDTTLMYMATPTDIFAVPEAAARMAQQRYEERNKLTAVPLQLLSGGHFLQPHLTDLITADDGQRYGIVDCLVLEQGPNYALAKRLQQWRAIVARAAGQRVSLNVAPATTTQSVIKNSALKAAYNGAHIFGIEIFAPETTNAIMAALWIHDLRCQDCAAVPTYPLNNPLELFMHGANHGGLWRVGFLPRSALPLAAIVGFVHRQR